MTGHLVCLHFLKMLAKFISLGLLTGGFLLEFAPLPVLATSTPEWVEQSVAKIVVEKTVLVERPRGSGERQLEEGEYLATGFALDGTNFLVTCFHVVHNFDVLTVEMKTGQTWRSDLNEIRLCYVSPAHDLAVISVPDKLRGLVLSEASPAKWQPIYSVGHSNGRGWSVKGGSVTELVPANTLREEIAGFPKIECDLLECDSRVGPGSSGGVFLDRETDQVLGMVLGGLHEGQSGQNFAIPANVLRQRLRPLLNTNSCMEETVLSDLQLTADDDAQICFDYFPLYDQGLNRPSRLFLTTALTISSDAGGSANSPMGPMITAALRLTRKWETTASLYYFSGEYSKTVSDNVFPSVNTTEIKSILLLLGGQYAYLTHNRLSLQTGAHLGGMRDQFAERTQYDSRLLSDQEATIDRYLFVGAISFGATIYIWRRFRADFGVTLWNELTDTRGGRIWYTGIKWALD